MKVHEIFTSIDGEVNGYHQGRVSTFLRLQGCNLRCSYCDTKKAQDLTGGEFKTIDQIVEELFVINTSKITITGGEPLTQPRGLIELIPRLVNCGKCVSIETNGSLPIIPMTRVSYVVDYKLPSSGESERMSIDNFADLGPRDWVKFVVDDGIDYIEAISVMEKIQQLAPAVNFAMSPVIKGKADFSTAKWLVDLMVTDKIDAIFNLQLHKVLEVA